MKLRLVLKTKTNNDKEVSIKFNIAPSQHIGFINFLNLAINQDRKVSLTFEKVSKSGEREESKVAGVFKFQAKDKAELLELEREVLETDRKKKKHRHK